MSDPYRGELPVTREAMEQYVSKYTNERLEIRDKRVAETARVVKWLAIAVPLVVIAMMGLAGGWWAGLHVMDARFNELKERIENGPVAPDDRHEETRRQDEALCERGCAALADHVDINGLSNLSATCAWEEAGVRRCSCACGLTSAGSREGRPVYVPSLYAVTESR